MKVCVTGANGFVGSKLCEALVQNGDAVVGLVRKSSDLQFLKSLKSIEIHLGDITQRSSLVPAFKDAEVVYHVAAFSSDWGDWEVFKSSNVDAVRNVMECALASKVRRVVHISSVSVYGFPNGTEIAEDQPFIARPEDPYISTKQEGERIALSYHGKGLEVVAIRPAGIYGPHDRTTSLKLLPALEKGQLPYVDGGKHVMAPVYIDNLIQAILSAARSEVAGGRSYNVMDEGKIGWKTYFEWFCEDLGCKKPPFSAPSWLVWPLACAVEGAAKLIRLKAPPPVTKYRIRAVMGDAHYSTKRAKEDLGYQPAVSTREGIRRTVSWYRDYTKKSREAR